MQCSAVQLQLQLQWQFPEEVASMNVGNECAYMCDEPFAQDAQNWAGDSAGRE